MDTENNKQENDLNELSLRNSLYGHDLTSIIIAITSFSIFLSFIFNISYFLTISPKFLMLFSTSDYLSSGVFFVALIFFYILFLELREYTKINFKSSKSKIEQKNKEKEERQKIENDKQILYKRINDATTKKELLEIRDELDEEEKSHKKSMLLLNVIFQCVPVSVWLICAFPRFDWLFASLILQQIVIYTIQTPIFKKNKPYRRLYIFSVTLTLLIFYTGAICATMLPLDKNKAIVEYEENGKLTELEGIIVRVLSKTIIIMTDTGYIALDRDTPLQIHYKHSEYNYKPNGFYRFIKSNKEIAPRENAGK